VVEAGDTMILSIYSPNSLEVVDILDSKQDKDEDQIWKFESASHCEIFTTVTPLNSNWRNSRYAMNATVLDPRTDTLTLVRNVVAMELS